MRGRSVVREERLCGQRRRGRALSAEAYVLIAMPKGVSTARALAYRRSLIAASAGALLLFAPATRSWHAPGAVSPGHGRLECGECHLPAPGDARQQLQQKARFWLGSAERDAVFGALPVNNAVCGSCHRRPADRHPVSRFLEPRFAEARTEALAHRCTGCHLEHDGLRVSARPDVCRHCHGSLRMEDDPLTESHESLVARAEWSSCLRCHDFHGSHRRKTPRTLEAGVSLRAIEGYFATDDTPYGVREVVAR